MYVSPGYTYTLNSVVYNSILIVHDSSATMCPSQKLTGSPQSAFHLPSPPYKKAFPLTFLLIKTIEKQTCESLDYYSVLHSTSSNITYVFYNQNLSQSVLCFASPQPSPYPNLHLKFSHLFSRTSSPQYFPNNVLFSKLCTYCSLVSDTLHPLSFLQTEVLFLTLEYRLLIGTQK